MKKFQKKKNIVIVMNFLIFVIIMRELDLNLFSLNLTTSIKKQVSNQKQATIQKYILYKCSSKSLCGGLVDRFKGILNAYAWSLFTKRQLIIKITKPCDFIYLIVPNRVNWNINLDELVKFGHLKANYSIHKIDMSFRSKIANIDIINYQNASEVISIFTNLELISVYARNKYDYD